MQAGMVFMDREYNFMLKVCIYVDKLDIQKITIHFDRLDVQK